MNATYDGEVENFWVAALWSILPTIVVTIAFFYIIRSVLRMDRTERRVYARIEAEERAKRSSTAIDASAE